uniref:Uncharacterized protein n=1 Tax=Arundo donax TaxID=35708 RepID=A0A0A9FU71_ARUDO
MGGLLAVTTLQTYRGREVRTEGSGKKTVEEGAQAQE